MEDEKVSERWGVDKALNIPYILENIFSCMDWKTLCECRQVSDIWYKYTLISWCDLAPSINLSKYDMTKGKVLNELALSLGREEAYRWGGVEKYKNLTIVCTILKMTWINRFTLLSERGTFVTTLHIDSCTFPNLYLLKEVVFCKYTPNLASLKLTYLTFDFRFTTFNTDAVDDDVKVVASLTAFDLTYCSFQFTRWPLSWVEFLSTYPNLKKLRVAEYSCGEMERISMALHELNKAGKLSSLIGIDFGDRRFIGMLKLPLSLYGFLRDGFRPNLHSISIAISHSDLYNVLENILNRLAEKLKYLKITGSFTEKYRCLKLSVVMSKLASITLVRYNLKNLNFLVKTPNLEKLYIYEVKTLEDSHNVISSSSAMSNGFECLHVNTFACNQIVAYEDTDISFLHTWMPNLSTLKLHLNDSSFFLLCKYFPKVSRLHICQSKVTDDGYIGVRNFENYNVSDDEQNSIITGYYASASVVSDNDIPLSDEPDDSDINDDDDSEKTDKSTPSRTISSNRSSRRLTTSSSAATSFSPLKGLNGLEPSDSGSKRSVELVEVEEEKEAGGTNKETNEEKSSTINESIFEEDVWRDFISNSDGVKDETRSSRERNILAFEKMYRTNLYVQTCEVVPFTRDYNVSSLQDLEVLVIQRCDDYYGISGIVSSVSFRDKFSFLPKLREVWVEDGVVTAKGLQRAKSIGLFRDYNTGNNNRPLFID